MELFTPGAFFLWMGISAFLVGLLALLLPFMSWEFEVILFSLLSVASVVLWRKHLHKKPIDTDHPLLNQRSAQYIGRVFTLDQAIINGRGKAKVGDSLWKVEGEDCPEGQRVEVVAVKGVVLQVKTVDKGA